MIFAQLTEQLNTLKNLLNKLNDESYRYSSKHLGNYTIASHTRHIIELLQCALIGYNSNNIDYINRSRDMQLETDKIFAINSIESIIANLNKPDKLVQLVTETANGCSGKTITTTYYRELVYNTEHVIHHLALIKVALIEMDLDVVEENFGMAYATIKYNANKVY